MMKMSVRVDKVSLRPLIRENPRVASQVLNRVLKKSRTELWRLIRSDYTVKRTAVFKTFSLWNASPTRLVARLRVKRGLISLTEFKNQYTGRKSPGVWIEARRGQRKLLKGAFRFDGRWGKTIAYREGTKNKPIHAMFSVPAYKMAQFYAPKMFPGLIAMFETEFLRRMSRVRPRVTRK